MLERGRVANQHCVVVVIVKYGRSLSRRLGHCRHSTLILVILAEDHGGLAVTVIMRVL